MIDLTQRIARVEPLGVLLVSVEDKWGTDEAIVDELLHVAHGGAVPKGKAEFCLEPLCPGERRCTTRFREVVRDGLLAQHVLAGVERRPTQIEMRRAGSADIHQVDITPRDELLVAFIYVRNTELCGEFTRAFDNRIGDGDKLASGVACISRQVSKLRPSTSAEYANANFPGGCHAHCTTRDVSPGRSSCRCAHTGAIPLVMIRS